MQSDTFPTRKLYPEQWHVWDEVEFHYFRHASGLRPVRFPKGEISAAVRRFIIFYSARPRSLESQLTSEIIQHTLTETLAHSLCVYMSADSLEHRVSEPLRSQEPLRAEKLTCSWSLDRAGIQTLAGWNCSCPDAHTKYSHSLMCLHTDSEFKCW